MKRRAGVRCFLGALGCGLLVVVAGTGCGGDQSSESGVEVVTDLHTHSLGENASTYLDMMRWNVDLIVDALR